MWGVVIGIQLLYILFIYTKTAFAPRTDTSVTTGSTSATGITVVVCTHNELANITELLPLLDAQTYPTFEVLVMDDRSKDGTDTFLETEALAYSHVRFIRIETEAEHVTPKKYALTIALKKARYPAVLLIDADCRPASADWLAGMAAHLNNPATALVLGVSLYRRQPGLLNFLIRSETLFTAVQYLSLALAGKPYMGVGRNLMYRRELFFANKGFYTHMRILGGDDDLFVNEVATPQNIAVSLHPDTFTWSAPKETWPDWLRQKRRHLHVGKLYKPGHKARLALLTGSHVLTWLLGLAAALTVGMLWRNGYPFSLVEKQALLAGAGAFSLRLVAFWVVVGRISQRLNRTVKAYIMPVMDGVLALYYLIAGIRTLLSRQRKPMEW